MVVPRICDSGRSTVLPGLPIHGSQIEAQVICLSAFDASAVDPIQVLLHTFIVLGLLDHIFIGQFATGKLGKLTNRLSPVCKGLHILREVNMLRHQDAWVSLGLWNNWLLLLVQAGRHVLLS